MHLKPLCIEQQPLPSAGSVHNSWPARLKVAAGVIAYSKRLELPDGLHCACTLSEKASAKDNIKNSNEHLTRQLGRLDPFA